MLVNDLLDASLLSVGQHILVKFRKRGQFLRGLVFVLGLFLVIPVDVIALGFLLLGGLLAAEEIGLSHTFDGLGVLVVAPEPLFEDVGLI